MPASKVSFLHLAGVSALALFLELALIRWVPAHVLYLTFFTNSVLLACFLGLSAGCLAASRGSDWLGWTPPLVALLLAAALGLDAARPWLEGRLVVGAVSDPQLVFFGTNPFPEGAPSRRLPVEVLAAAFFCLIALAAAGLGTELGRAWSAAAAGGRPLAAYAANLGGSMAGTAAFAALSWLEAGPAWWFHAAALGVAMLLWRRRPWERPGWAPKAAFAGRLALLGSWVGLAAATTTGRYYELRPAQDRFGDVVVPAERLWSPYYRIDYVGPPVRDVSVNLIGHQKMVARARGFFAYSLPHSLREHSGGPPFRDALVIGAGSGNDVSRALQWGAESVDAVEIDPAIARLGRRDHPDRPYDDPRVSVRVEDGRRWLKRGNRSYDLVVYALVDSLVLHSGYSNIRLESFLFTREAFEDAKRRLKPGGWLVAYNYYREGWIVARIAKTLAEVFGSEPLVLTLPYQDRVSAGSRGGLTLIIAGDVEPLRRAFRERGAYWLRQGMSPEPGGPSGFRPGPVGREAKRWLRFGPAAVEAVPDLPVPTDDWPFLYLRRPMLPDLSLRGMALMALLSAALMAAVRLGSGGRAAAAPSRGSAWRMFWLGVGFMLLECKAVVQMALVFGSTWMVNTAVFLAVLAAALGANWLAWAFGPRRLWPWYAAAAAGLALQAAVPVATFLPWGAAGSAAAAALALLPLLPAGVIFSSCFARTRAPERDFGANIAGALAGGLAENASMLLGFRGLALVAAAAYALSAAVRDPD